MKTATYYIIFFLFWTVNGVAVAQKDTVYSSKDIRVEVRMPSQEEVEKFNRNKHFQYDEESESFVPGLMERLLYWILKKILPAINYSEVRNVSSNIWDYVIIPLAVLIILFVILKLLGVNVSGVFGRKTKQIDIPYEVGNEDVRSSEFDELLENAIVARNYRLAVRYLYLRILQELNALEWIQWNPNKTNHAYIRELASDPALQDSFGEKVYLFEQVWYGEYRIEEPEFRQIQDVFITFTNKLKQPEAS